MVTPHIKAFPNKWFDLFDWFEANPNEQLVIEAEDPGRAHSLRFEFYRARSAALKNPVFQEGYKNTALREVSLNGNVVTFRLKSHSPISQLLATALKKQGIGEPQPDGLGHSDVDNGAL